MPPSTETTTASLGRLFKGPNALLSTSWIDYVPTGWTDDSLHHLVVSTGTLRAAKSWDLYGHFRTATSMQKIEGTYWRKDPTPILVAEALALNPIDATPEARLHQLCTGAVGGLLLVTQLQGQEGDVQPPLLRS
jgi:hypothetical protein